jgi:hypothetical protein
LPKEIDAGKRESIILAVFTQTLTKMRTDGVVSGENGSHFIQAGGNESKNN